MTLRSSRGCCTLRYSERDLGMLGGPFLKEGSDFAVAAGIYDHFAVADGPNVAAVTQKKAVSLLAAARSLFHRLESDAPLLRHDYKFSIQPWLSKPGGGAVSGLRLVEPLLPYDQECTVGIDARPQGQIYLTIHLHHQEHWHGGGALDLRLARPFATDRGIVRVHRGRAQTIGWLSELPRLIELLPLSRTETVEIRHHFVGDAFDSEEPASQGYPE